MLSCFAVYPRQHVRSHLPHSLSMVRTAGGRCRSNPSAIGYGITCIWFSGKLGGQRVGQSGIAPDDSLWSLSTPVPAKSICSKWIGLRTIFEPVDKLRIEFGVRILPRTYSGPDRHPEVGQMRAENEFFRQCVTATVLKFGETNAESRGSQRMCRLFQNLRLAQTCAMPYPARNMTPKGS